LKILQKYFTFASEDCRSMHHHSLLKIIQKSTGIFSGAPSSSCFHFIFQTLKTRAAWSSETLTSTVASLETD